MKRKNRLLPITLCASVVFHAGAFFFVTVKSKSFAGTPERDAGVFSLININIPEEPAPLEPPPAPPPEPLSEPPPVPVAAIPEPENGPAETFIITEEIPPEAEGPVVPAELPAALPTVAVSGMPGRTGERRDGAGHNAALAETYIRRNFTYIQRRIRNRLVYPSQARRAGIQGAAEIGFTVHLDGTVSAVTVLVSSGQESLDQAALAAIYAAAPFPAPPVQARLAIPVSFRLR
jgi:protein TonB